jgi:hypothetical protein
MIEVGTDHAGGENRLIEGKMQSIGSRNKLGGSIDARHFGHDHRDVALRGQDRSDRPSEIGRRQPGSSDLLKQRLKTVMVLHVQQRDLDIRVGGR